MSRSRAGFIISALIVLVAGCSKATDNGVAAPPTRVIGSDKPKLVVGASGSIVEAARTSTTTTTIPETTTTLAETTTRAAPVTVAQQASDSAPTVADPVAIGPKPGTQLADPLSAESQSTEPLSVDTARRVVLTLPAPVIPPVAPALVLS